MAGKEGREEGTKDRVGERRRQAKKGWLVSLEGARDGKGMLEGKRRT